jgi:hypothetical protein
MAVGEAWLFIVKLGYYIDVLVNLQVLLYAVCTLQLLGLSYRRRTWQMPLFWEVPGFGLHKGAAQGSRHRAQGKNNNRKLISSLRLAPYALCLTC